RGVPARRRAERGGRMTVPATRTRTATPQDRRLEALAEAALRFRDQVPTIEAWGRALARVLRGGGRLLACGNGGSAAEAQHLTAELVGRFEDERRPLSAIPLHGDTSSVTAIGNDYGADSVFARQVQAHGRPGGVLVCLSTSGRSPHVVEAARTGRRAPRGAAASPRGASRGRARTRSPTRATTPSPWTPPRPRPSRRSTSPRSTFCAGRSTRPWG